MKFLCPLCLSVIPAARRDAASDMAACDYCGVNFSLADLTAGASVPDGFALRAPPSGAWFEKTTGGWRLGASLHRPDAWLLVAFVCAWVSAALWGFVGSQITEGELDPGLTLIGIPFLFGGVLMGGFVAMLVAGKVVVAVEGDAGSVFAGVGRLGSTTRFDWSAVTAVAMDVGYARGESRMAAKAIILAAPQWFRFGQLLRAPRREYMLHALRALLADRGPPRG
jgi:hypothetical protein